MTTKKSETKTQPVSVRMPPKLKAAIEALAAQDRRSISTYIVFALEDHVERVTPSKARRPKA